jgi:NADPH:quinone reductase-like Zn-dependent oxidoreductase
MMATFIEEQATTTMKAFVRERYGSPEVLELREREKPEPAEDELLVRVRAFSPNPVDWHELTGMPYLVRLLQGLRRPKDIRLGGDFAGTVEAVGANVDGFRPGDEVFGVRHAAFGEYITVPQDRAVVPKPAQASFEQAAVCGVAALTALQGLRDKGELKPGEKVLVNGASGGVGTFAVQMARALGAAEVAGVCNADKVEQARALGADPVIDYTREDFTRRGERYDVIVDIGGTHSWSACRRALTEHGRLVCVSGPKTNRVFGPLGRMISGKLGSVRCSQEFVPFIAKPVKEDMEIIAAMLAEGSVIPVIERTYGLDELPEAMAYLGEGHARGKLVVTI